MSVKKNIIIDAGANFLMTCEYTHADGTPIDLTGYNARIILTEINNDTSYVFSSQDPGSLITIIPTEGKVKFELKASETASLNITKYTETITYRYVAEIYNDDGVVKRLLRGNALVLKG